MGNGINTIKLKGRLYDVNISIYGENNSLTIEDSTNINHTDIIIKGNNCNLLLKSGTGINGAELVLMGNGNSLTIGEDCMLANEITIWATDSHPIYNLKNEILNPSLPVSIGNHVWIGKGATILKGVTIGDNSVIGMKTLVTKDIPPSTISVGNPNRIVKKSITWDRVTIPI